MKVGRLSSLKNLRARNTARYLAAEEEIEREEKAAKKKAEDNMEIEATEKKKKELKDMEEKRLHAED